MKILIVGSDLGNPFVTMESKLVSEIISSSSEMSFHVLSVEIIGKMKTHKNFTAVKGLKFGWSKIRKLIYGLEMLLKFIFLLRIRFDVIHFVWVGFSPLTQMFMLFSHLSGAKVAVTVLNRHSPKNRYSQADAFIVHSQDLYRAYAGSVAKNKIIRKLNPTLKVDTAMSGNIAERPYFLFLSGPKTREHLHPRGVFFLFELFAKLQQVDPKIRLCFANRWAEGRAILETMKLKSKVNNIDFIHTPVDDVHKLIRGSRGVVIPYIGGSIGDVPLSAIEALACGRPVIATKESGLAQEFTNRTEVTLLDANIVEWVEAMMNISHQTKGLEQGCRALYEHYSDVSYSEQHYELYRDLLKVKP